jgi:hypothetical protein
VVCSRERGRGGLDGNGNGNGKGSVLDQEGPPAWKQARKEGERRAS